MAWVYILKSKKTGRFYIGSTGDIERRIKEHQSGKTKSIKNFLPTELIFKQNFLDMKIARKIEARLKRLKRRDYLEKIIRDGQIKMVI